MKGKKFCKNLTYEVDLNGKEPEFFMKIGFESIDEMKLSIAHKRFSNKGSGLVRHSGNPTGVRIIDGQKIDGVYTGNKMDARLYHNTIEEHIECLELGKDERDLILISNGNLLNDYSYVAIVKEKEGWVTYHLRSEPFLGKPYTCLIVPEKGNPKIKDIMIGDSGLLESKEGTKWATYGHQIVRNSQPVPLDEIIDRFYNVMHIFNLKDYGANEIADIKKMNEIYSGFPDSFRDNMAHELREGAARADYYHSTLGVTNDSLAVLHSEGKVEEIAQKAIDRGMKDGIILDQGGSVGVYSSWNGFLTKSSYFRPDRISWIGVVLKNS